MRAEEVEENNSDLPLVKSTAMEEQYGEAPARERRGKLRVPRPSYYNILDMQDKEMKTSYLLRDTEVLKNEIDEDQAVENYWADQFSGWPSTRHVKESICICVATLFVIVFIP